MLTPKEHIEEYNRTYKFPAVLWCHALDVLKHTLEGKQDQTFFKTKNRGAEDCLIALSRKLDGLPKEQEAFMKVHENTETQERRWKRFDCEYGDLVVERYLDGDERPFDDYRKKYVQKPSVTLTLDIGVNGSDRNRGDMKERHKKVYEYAIQANREGRPCRVLAVTKISIPEMPDYERIALVLKDFDDPIFPSIWAAFETNASTNDFLNVMQDYFIGTRAWGNGSCETYNVWEDHQDSEVILIEPCAYIEYVPDWRKET